MVEMQNKDKIIISASYYSVVRLVAQILLIIRGFIIARLLGPSLFGIWNIFLVILGYSQHSHMGMYEGMVKEIPYYKGCKKPEKIEQIKNTVFYSMFFISIFIALTLIIISFLLEDNYSPIFINGLRFVAILVIIQQMYAYYLGLLTANSHFIIISKITFIFSFLSVVFMYPFVLLYGLNGAIYSITLSYLFALIIIRRTLKYKFHFNIALSEVRRLLKVGFPLLLISFMYVLLGTIDKLMIAGLINEGELGYYSIAVVISNFTFYVPTIVGAVIFPSMMETLGAHDNIKHLNNYLIDPILIIAYLMPIVIGFVYLSFPLFLKYLLPDFMPSIGATKILLLFMYFMALNSISSKFIIATNKQNNILGLQIFAVFLGIGLNYIFIKLGWGIEGVALATGITYMVYGNATTIFAFNQVTNKLVYSFKKIISLWMPFLYLSILIILLDNVFLQEIQIGIFYTMLKIMFFTILNLPLIVHIDKRTNIVHDLIHIAKMKLMN